MADVPTEKERTQIVEFLTNLRESVDPPASNMMLLAKTNAVDCAEAKCTPQGNTSDLYLTICLFLKNGGNADEGPCKHGESCIECPDGVACHRKRCFNNLLRGANPYLPITDIYTKLSSPAAVGSTNSPTARTSIASEVFPVMLMDMLACGLCLIG
uniref:SCP domain-containing protein n=1 Tax=Mesocestoides corti TaxID=53468 RepID=A0A5K3FHM3_MESCO